MAKTKADRQAAAKKAAATRERNRKRAKSETAGQKAAATRQRNLARDSAEQAQRAASAAASNVATAAKSVGGAVAGLGKSAAARARIKRD